MLGADTLKIWLVQHRVVEFARMLSERLDVGRYAAVLMRASPAMLFIPIDDAARSFAALPRMEGVTA
jgi:hypothetical protein